MALFAYFVEFLVGFPQLSNFPTFQFLLFFNLLVFSFHPFTLVVYQPFTVNPSYFSFHTAFTPILKCTSIKLLVIDCFRDKNYPIHLEKQPSRTYSSNFSVYWNFLSH